MIVDPQVIYYRKSLLDKAGHQAAGDDRRPDRRVEGTDHEQGRRACSSATTAANRHGWQRRRLWSSGGDFLTDGQQARLHRRRAAQAFGKLHELYASKSILLGAPTDWWDPSAINQGLVAMQWIGMWAVPGMQKALRRRHRRDPVPEARRAGQASAVYSGGWTQFVSAKSANVDAAKKYVKWLWIDKAEYQEDWSLNYGFHIPPRKSLAAKASKLQSGVAAETREADPGLRHTRQPELDAEDGLRRSATCSPTSSGREPTPPQRSPRPRRPSTPSCPVVRMSAPARRSSADPATAGERRGPRRRGEGDRRQHAVVLGVRRAVRARPAGLLVPADHLEPDPQLLRGVQHGHAVEVRRAAELHRHAHRPQLPVQPGHVHDLRGVHRAADVRAVARRWRCWSTR